MAVVKQLLFADFIPGRPHFMWMEGATQDLSTLGPRAPAYRWTASETCRSWRMTGILEGGCQAVLALLVLVVPGLRCFSCIRQVCSSRSLAVFVSLLVCCGPAWVEALYNSDKHFVILIITGIIILIINGGWPLGQSEPPVGWRDSIRA